VLLELETLEDLQQLANEQVRESAHLEFKRSEAFKNPDGNHAELLKDITAFANAEGGQIIYGMMEEIVDGVAVARGLDGGIDGTKIREEWLPQLVEQNTSPKLRGVSAHPVSINGNRVAYVVTVPERTLEKPFQNGFDKRYYRRSDRRAVMMEGYEIREMIQRVVSPKLRVRFTFPDERTELTPSETNTLIELIPNFENLSTESAQYSFFEIFIDARLKPRTTPGGIPRKRVREFGIYKLLVYQKAFAVPGDMPLTEGFSITVNPMGFTLKVPEHTGDKPESYILGYVSRSSPHSKSEGYYPFTIFQGHAFIGEELDVFASVAQFT
jgi:hypothetical protein